MIKNALLKPRCKIVDIARYRLAYLVSSRLLDCIFACCRCMTSFWMTSNVHDVAQNMSYACAEATL